MGLKDKLFGKGNAFNTRLIVKQPNKSSSGKLTTKSASKTSDAKPKKYSEKSSLPKTTSAIPMARPSTKSVITKRDAYAPTHDRSATATEMKYASGPSKRGGGPPIAMSKANLDKRKASKSEDKIRTPGKYKLPKF